MYCRLKFSSYPQMNECVPELNQEYAFDILLCLAQQMLPITEL